MIRSTASRLFLAFPTAAAVLLGGLASSADAQGTAAQREACTPDAIRLCQDAIPDVEKTTACMKAHEAELSPSCHRVFAASEPSSSAHRGHRRVAAVARPAAEASGAPILGQDIDVSRFGFDLPDTQETRTSDAEDLRNARRVVRRLCRTEILDANTCRLTQGAMNLAQ